MLLPASRFTMSIASHNIALQSSSFSSLGSANHVSCPGTDITSTDRTGDAGKSKIIDNLSIGLDYANSQGTSYSSPICAGIGALILSARPGLGYRDVQEILALSALNEGVQLNQATYNLIPTLYTNKARQLLNGVGLRSDIGFGFGAVSKTVSHRYLVNSRTLMRCHGEGMVAHQCPLSRRQQPTSFMLT